MQVLTAKKEWSDSIVTPFVMEQLKPFAEALKKHSSTTREQDDKKDTRVFAALFLGTKGCGRTTTAAALGKMARMEVYCIDLSQVVSKYIGEQKKILLKYLMPLLIKTGYYFLMKQMHYLVNALM